MTRAHATPPGTGPAEATITVSVWHNVTRDSAERPTGYFGFTPGDLMVKVFTYDTQVRGRHAEDRRLRSVSRGDMITVGEAALIVERAGFSHLPGGFTPVRVNDHGTHPL